MALSEGVSITDLNHQNRLKAISRRHLCTRRKHRPNDSQSVVCDDAIQSNRLPLSDCDSCRSRGSNGTLSGLAQFQFLCHTTEGVASAIVNCVQYAIYGDWWCRRAASKSGTKWQLFRGFCAISRVAFWPGARREPWRVGVQSRTGFVAIPRRRARRLQEGSEDCTLVARAIFE